MEAAAKLRPNPLRRRDAPERRLEELRPLGEAFLLRRFSGISRADAEDAVAEVIIRLHSRIAEGRAPDNLRAAFFTSVRNAAIDQFRSRQARPTVGLELLAETAGEDPAPAERAESRDDAIRLQEALDRMRPNYREAILLRFGLGLTVPEISERLRISLPAAKKLVLRATEQARKRLAAIEEAQFCPQMRDRAHQALVDRELAGLADPSEQRLLEAHFQHCGPCKSYLVRLHDGLHELSGTALVAGVAGEGAGPGLGIVDHATRWIDHASEAAGAAAAKLRLSAYKASGAFNGAGDAGSAGLLGAGAQKAIAACGAATATAATCVATGLVGPGLGVDLDHQAGDRGQEQAAAISKPASETPVVDLPPAPASPVEPEPEPVQAPPAPTEPPPAPAAAHPDPEASAPPPEPAAEQFGFEAGASSSESAPAPQPAPAPAPAPEPEPAPAPAPSSGAADGSAGKGGESFGFDG